MNLGFCTITSRSRLCQGVALYNSLQRNMSTFTLFFLCTDSEAYNILKGLQLSKAVVLQLSEVEDEELLSIKGDRTENEYCWTLKPFFLSYILARFPHIDTIAHVDADLYFFSDPYTIFHEGAKHSVLLTRHLHAVNDDINSGFVSFKRDAQGQLCLEWWKRQCIDWCYFRQEGSKFGDQAYLNEMLANFKGILVVQTPGVNIAPWNSYRFNFTRRGPKIYVNDDILIFYHFCGFRMINSKEYAIIYTPEDIPVIYEPYISELGGIVRQVENISPGFCDRSYEPISPDKILRRGLF